MQLRSLFRGDISSRRYRETPRLVAVVVPDQIGRTAVLAVHLENLGSYLRLPHHAPLDVETVTHFGMHHSSRCPLAQAQTNH